MRSAQSLASDLHLQLDEESDRLSELRLHGLTVDPTVGPSGRVNAILGMYRRNLRNTALVCTAHEWRHRQ